MKFKSMTAKEKAEFFREENVMGLLEKEAQHIIDRFDSVERFVTHMKGYNRAMISTLNFFCLDAPKPMKKFASGDGKQRIYQYLIQLWEFHHKPETDNGVESENCKASEPRLLFFLGKNYQ